MDYRLNVWFKGMATSHSLLTLWTLAMVVLGSSEASKVKMLLHVSLGRAASRHVVTFVGPLELVGMLQLAFVNDDWDSEQHLRDYQDPQVLKTLRDLRLRSKQSFTKDMQDLFNVLGPLEDRDVVFRLACG